jgi:hypothetical protein
MMRSPNSASISASVIGAASRTRLCAALPASSATAINGSRASGEVLSTLAPRPLASRNASASPPRFFARRSGKASARSAPADVPPEFA